MAQHDYDIANGSGSTVRADINAVLGAIASSNSGTSAPSVTFAYMLWADTTNNILKIRNSANTGWVSLLNTDGSLLDHSVSNAKIRQGAALSVIGVTGNATADVADIAAGTDGFVLRRSGTALGFGTVATAGITANAVDNTIIRQGVALSVIGVTGNATSNVADIAAGSDGFVLRRSGTALGFGTVATAGIADNAVSNAKIRQGVALSVIGVTGNATANVDDIAAGTDGFVLRRSGTALGFGTVATAGIADAAVTYAKIQNVSATSRLLGRITAGAGSIEELTAANVKTILALVKGDVGLGNVDNTSDTTKWAATATLTNKTFDAAGTGNVLSNIATSMFATNVVDTDTSLTANSDTRLASQKAVKTYVSAAVAAGVSDGDKGDVVVSSSGTVWTIDAQAVSYSKIQNVSATNRILGRITAGAGSIEELTAANVKTILGLTSSDVGLGNVDNTSDATKNAASVTLTNKRITTRIGTETSSATSTPTADSVDQWNVTALAAADAFAAPSGTPTDGQKLMIRIKDNGTARALSWNAIYRAIGLTLPTTTVISKTLYIGCVYNAADSKWDVVATGQE